jgi:hypothetical protein
MPVCKTELQCRNMKIFLSQWDKHEKVTFRSHMIPVFWEKVAGFRQKAWLVAPNTGYLADIFQPQGL